jgi:pimeloyl-ACP methyl ester carboxylesterase
LRVGAAALSAACVAALSIGEPVAAGPGPPRALGGVGAPIPWTECGERLECGRVRVPLDWDRPAGRTKAAPAQAENAEPGSTGSPARGPTAAPGDFARRVAIRGGRKLYLECRGKGSPTVMLEAGTGDLAEIWSDPPIGPGRAVLPAVAGFTRVCAYDRPGTYLLPDELSRSDPVAMPRSARDILLDLRALLRAARVPGPYVLAGHSFGGMVARLYATTHPRRIAGLVSIDAQNEDFVAAYNEFLTPEQYEAAVLNPQPPPGLEGYPEVERLSLEVSAAQMRQAHADTPLRRMPLVVLSHSRELPNPFGFPPDWPIEALEQAFKDSQDELAQLVPGARHVIASRSTHYIQLDQPRLVTREIRRIVREARSRLGNPSKPGHGWRWRPRCRFRVRLSHKPKSGS